MTQAAFVFDPVRLNPSVDGRDADRLSKQCVRLLERLRKGPATNVELMVDLRILNLTARVSELREAGHQVNARRGAQGVWTYSLGSP